MVNDKKPIKVTYPKFNINEENPYQEEMDKLVDKGLSQAGVTRTRKNIIECLTKSLKSKYGITDKETLKTKVEAILKLHGLSEENFDPLAVISKLTFGNLQTVNDVSVDENANKTSTNMEGICAEANLAFKKLVGYDYLYQTLKELYGKAEAKKCCASMYDMSLFLHDATNILKPYSYYGHTSILIRINYNDIRMVTLKKLWEMYEHHANGEFIDTTDLKDQFVVENVYLSKADKFKGTRNNCKIKNLPFIKQHLEVWDLNNGWVDIKRIIKHQTDKDFIFYQTNNGDFALVTEDHPIYMSDGTEKLAKDLKIEDEILKEDLNLPNVYKNIEIDEKLAYVSGFLLGDGNYNAASLDYSKKIFDKRKEGLFWRKGGNGISVYQNDIENSYIKKQIDESFNNINWFKFSDKQDRCLSFSSYDYNYMLANLFGYTYKENSYTKHLPENFNAWTDESIYAFLAGLIDSDGSVVDNFITIRMASYSVINQLYDVLYKDNSFKGLKKILDKQCEDKKLVCGFVFRILKDHPLIKLSKKVENAFKVNPNKFEKYETKYINSRQDNKIAKIYRFNRNDVAKTSFFNQELENVYDITTASGRFYANGMVQHNCYCIDASKLVVEGRDFGQVHSGPAHRVSTYVTTLGDTIREISFNIAGACCYKDTNLVIKKDDKKYIKNIKELVSEMPLLNTYSNYQGNWEYADISDKNIYVHEYGKFVKINKVMRRKYDGDIYEITTKSGKKIKCSKDHIFKVLYKGRDIEVKASDLQLYDTVYNSMLVKQFEIDKESSDYKRGQFIGILCGDGNITNKYDIRIAIHKDQDYVDEFIETYVKDVYNLECHRIDDHRKGDCTYTLRINSVDVYNDIKKDIIGDTALDKHIDISTKSFDYLCGFVDGMAVTDGGYNHSIAFGNISKELIQNIYDISVAMNIPTGNVKEFSDKRPNRHTVYNLNISLKFFNYLKLMQLKTLSKKRSATRNLEDVAYYGYNAFPHSMSINCSNKVKRYQERDIKIHEPVTDVIIDIKTFKNDDEYVYEIETESHWYSINGILTHNCAIGTFFLDIANLAIYKERITLDDLQNDRKVRKAMANHMQQFIYTVNHYSRNAVESPFTNISLFDREKLRGLISEDNYGWYFPKKAAVVEDNGLENSKDAFKEFVLDYIEELQEIYLDVFDAGDPLRNGLQFPFPVTTINLSTEVDASGKNKLMLQGNDNALLEYIVHKDISKYNLYCSRGSKVASCCRLLSDSEMLGLGSGVNSFGGSQVSLGSHRVVTIDFSRCAYEAESYDDFKRIITDRVEEMTKILKAHRVLIHKLEKCGTQPWITNGWINMSHMFSTYGCAGYVEADEILKFKFNHADFDYMKDFLVYFNKECMRVGQREKMIWNLEAVPFEGGSPKAAKANKVLFADENGDYVID